MPLPKNYISWSQINLWNTSRSGYRKRYYENEPMFETKWLRYGKRFAEIMEGVIKDEITFAEYEVLSSIQVPDKSEVKYTHEIDGVTIVGYLDGLNENEIVEYKTGTKEWDYDRALNHGQVHLYAWMHFELTGVIPSVNLIWIETADVSGQIEPTGRVESFEYQVTMDMIEQIKETTLRTISEIFMDYEKYLSGTMVTLDKRMTKAYTANYAKVKELEQKLKQYKEDFKMALIEAGATDYSDEYITAFYTNRKTYNYTPKDEAKIKEAKAELKAIETNAKKRAEVIENNTLTIRTNA